MFAYMKQVMGNDRNSFAVRLRRQRFEVFKTMLLGHRRPIRILDVGGTQIFWENMDFCHQEGLTFVLLNKVDIPTKYPQFSSVIGDARDMRQFGDGEFDFVFSNSVIQYVGPEGYQDQAAMAREIRRIGRRYFVQTPYRHFPLEPHFIIPFFQYLPLEGKAWLLSHFKIGWCKQIPDRQAALRIAQNVRMLDKRELKDLFPEGMIVEEKLLGLTKSLIVHN